MTCCLPSFDALISVFNMLLNLFVFQGDVIDNIEKNVSQSVDHIVEAREQTKKAVRYQTKARKVMSFGPLLQQIAATSSSLFLRFQPCTSLCLAHSKLAVFL